MKPYRITIIVDEYDNEGFWSVSELKQILKTKKELTETLTKFYNESLTYIEEILE